MVVSNVIGFVVKEIEEALPAMIFFAVGFNLIVLTTKLIVDNDHVQIVDFAGATVGALFAGKAVLVANALPFMRRLDTAPLIRPILFKTFNYWLVVGVIRFLEQLIEYATHGGRLAGIPEYVHLHFHWNRFAAIQIWIFVLFLIFTTATEVIELFGAGEVRKIFFASGSLRGKLMRHPQ